MASQSDQPLVEELAIGQVPEDQRFGKPSSLFYVWFACSLSIATVVLGPIMVYIGNNLFWAVMAIVVGNVVGSLFMAAHSAQGPILGVPQLIQSRGQFGFHLGAWLPVVLSIFMYIGFWAFGAIAAGQSLQAGVGGGLSLTAAILILGAMTLVVAILGYKYIHGTQLITTYVLLVALVVLSVQVVRHGGLDWSTSGFSAASWFIGVAIVATYQIGFGPYVSDYSRYLPKNVGYARPFWWSYAGTTIGAIWVMGIGALITAQYPDLTSVDGIVALMGDNALTKFVLLALAFAIIGINAINLYGGMLAILTGASSFTDRVKRGAIVAGRGDRRDLRRRSLHRADGIRRLPGQLPELPHPSRLRVHPVERDQPHRLLRDEARSLRRRSVLRSSRHLRHRSRQPYLLGRQLERRRGLHAGDPLRTPVHGHDHLHGMVGRKCRGRRHRLDLRPDRPSSGLLFPCPRGSREGAGPAEGRAGMTMLAKRMFLLEYGGELCAKAMSVLGGDDTVRSVPIIGIAVETSIGWVLLETGISRQALSDPDALTAIYGADCHPWGLDGDPMVTALSQVGLAVGDIALAAVSHLHLDHSGGLPQLAEAGVPVVIQRKELEFGLAEGDLAAADYRADFVRGIEWRVVDGDEEIAPGIWVFDTAGHTPGHQSYRVELPDSGTWVFAIDAADLGENLFDRVPVGTASRKEDEALLMPSLMRLFEEAERYDARLVPGHDPIFWKAVRHPRGGHT